MSVVDWFVRSPADAVLDLGPGVVDLRGYRGDTFTARLAFRYTDGTLVTLDGTWRAQLRTSAGDDAVLDSFTVDASEQAGGFITVSLTAQQTTALPQRATWDLENVADAGVRTWLAGILYLGGEVTR